MGRPLSSQKLLLSLVPSYTILDTLYLIITESTAPSNASEESLAQMFPLISHFFAFLSDSEVSGVSRLFEDRIDPPIGICLYQGQRSRPGESRY